MENKKVLIVGVGSMGERRLRIIRKWGRFEIGVVDRIEGRAKSAAERFDVRYFESLEDSISLFRPDVALVCTSPESHMDIAHSLASVGIDCFIEASVVDQEGIDDLTRLSAENNAIVLPSCTMKFFPLPRAVEKLVAQEGLPSILSISYHTGQRLEDWHPWENIGDYYVSKHDTGGCRELVPFELTWLNGIFGFPTVMCAAKGKTSDISADIDDFYSVTLKYPQGTILNLFVEVQSRPSPSREILIVGQDFQFQQSQMLGSQVYRRVGSPGQITQIEAHSSGNHTVNSDGPYEAELTAFFRAIEERNPSVFPNSLEEDSKILGILNLIDEMAS